VSAIFHGLLQSSVATAVHVGFSYGLARICGILVTAIPRRLRLPYVVLLVALWSWPVVLGPTTFGLTHPTFTEMGHTRALLTGLGLSTLVGSGHVR
jgi:hypothetical protein